MLARGRGSEPGMLAPFKCVLIPVLRGLRCLWFCRVTLQKPTVASGPGLSQEHSPGLPRSRQGPSSVSHHCCILGPALGEEPEAELVLGVKPRPCGVERRPLGCRLAAGLNSRPGTGPLSGCSAAFEAHRWPFLAHGRAQHRGGLGPLRRLPSKGRSAGRRLPHTRVHTHTHTHAPHTHTHTLAPVLSGMS